MAMLAEPRRKQKFSTDPRNLNWSNDDNRFGKKLMERMGWKGKGLGAKQDGNPDHISIRLKEDKFGLGCTRDYADNWVAHQDDFNALLSSLNANTSTEESAKTSVQSLEEKSKSSKGRIHYKKFAKGKDLTKANSEDMNCIFGRRLSKSAPSTPQGQSEESSDGEEESKKQGVVTIKSATSVQDYFKQKMAALKEKSQGVSLSAPVSANPSDEETQEPNRDGSVNRNGSNEPANKKKKKSKKSKDLEKEDEDVTSDREVVKKKSKKSKKQKKNKNDTPDDTEMQSCESQEVVNTEKSAKKKKKRKRETTDKEKAEIDWNEKKIPKKKRRTNEQAKNTNVYPSSDKFEHGNTESSYSSDETVGQGKQKEGKSKKKKSKEQEQEHDNNEQPSEIDIVERVDSVKPRKKRRDNIRTGEKFSQNPSKYFKGANLENIQGYGR